MRFFSTAVEIATLAPAINGLRFGLRYASPCSLIRFVDCALDRLRPKRSEVRAVDKGKSMVAYTEYLALTRWLISHILNSFKLINK